MRSEVQMIIANLAYYAEQIENGWEVIDQPGAQMLRKAAEHLKFTAARLEGAMQENSELRFENKDLATKLGKAAPAPHAPAKASLALGVSTHAILKKLDHYAEIFANDHSQDNNQYWSGMFTRGAECIKSTAESLAKALQENAELKRENETLKAQMKLAHPPVKRRPLNNGPSFGI